MIPAIDRKLLRDLRGMRMQALAIALVIACGVATFVMSLSTLEALKRSKDAYYERYRFAQVFTQLKRAPESLALRIAEIPGVTEVQTRIVMDVTLNVAGLDEPAVARLISMPEEREPVLNDLHLTDGRWFEPRREGEVVASQPFMEAHSFSPGARASAVINGRYRELKLVGTALSPEYIVQLPAGSLFPDDERYGIFWMGYDSLASAFNMEGAFNSVTLRLAPHASVDEVVRRLDLLTEDYGGLGAHGRSDQLSDRYISDEIRQLRGMGMITPTIFLAVAAFLLNMVLTRVVSMQREQIAALKAFGYTHVEVARHYTLLASLIIAAGLGLGAIGGVRLGLGLTSMYTEFYRFPTMDYRIEPGVIGLAVVVSALAGLVGVFAAIRRAVILPPAEAMRPEPPASFRPTVIERLGLGALFGQTARMILRQLERRPLKSALAALGIAMSVAILVLGSFFKDVIDYMMEFQFSMAERGDVTVTLVEPGPWRAYRELTALQGVTQAEPFRVVPVRMHRGHRSRLIAITGLAEHNELFRLLQRDGTTLRPLGDGLLMSEKLGEILRLRAGDEVRVEVLEGKRPAATLRVDGFISDFAGIAAYMKMPAVNRLMKEGPTVSGAYLKVDPAFEDKTYALLKTAPGVAGAGIKKAYLTSFRETMGENMLKFRAFNLFFACVIAFGVVYNSARISLSERSRELATLRVIGFTRREVSAILIGELLLLTAIAIPLGSVIGFGLAYITAAGVDSEFYRFPVIVHRATFSMAALVTLAAVLASCLIAGRRIAGLDLVSVLKIKE